MRMSAHHGAAGGEAGEGQTARRDLEDARAQSVRRFASQTVFGQLMVHAIGIFGDVSEPDPQLPEPGIFPGLEQARRQPYLVQGAPELVLPVGVIGFLQSRLAPGGGTAKDQLEAPFQAIRQNMGVVAHRRTIMPDALADFSPRALGATMPGPAHKAERPAPGSKANRGRCANPKRRTAPKARHSP